jgi:hypothetical protein
MPPVAWTKHCRAFSSSPMLRWAWPSRKAREKGVELTNWEIQDRNS